MVADVDFDDIKDVEGNKRKKLPFEPPPRVFRNVFVEKTLKLFYPGYKGKQIIQRTFKQNLWWFCVLLIGLVIATSFLFKALSRFTINPTFTTIILNGDGAKVSKPMIGVCPQFAIDAEKVSKITKFSSNQSSENTSEIVKIIPNFMIKNQILKSSDLKEINEFFKTDDPRILAFKLAASCSELLKNCEFKGHSIDCCLNFLPQMTEHGFCYLFNSRIYGTPLNDLKNPQIMTMNEFEDHTVNFEVTQPSKIFMHSRNEHLSHYHKEVITLNLNHSIKVLYSIRQTHTTDDLREFHANFRKCYFRDERKSTFYANEEYSYSGCLRDLVIENYLNECGCVVPYYRPSDIDNVTFCGLNDLNCLAKSARLKSSHKGRDSECFLPCDNDVYVPEKIQLVETKNSTKISFGLNLWPLVAFHRESRFGFLDFVVTFGSIFALFLDFSLLSFVEILLSIFKFLSTKFSATKSEA